jgi:biotin transport system ATP-binding protein
MHQMLNIEHLHFSFNKHPVLSDVSFTVPPGAFMILSGRNGSGKSVLLRCIKGLYPLHRGTIMLGDTDLSRKPAQRNRRIALVFQDADTQIVGQTVKRDILFGLENLGIPAAEQHRRLDETVQLLGLQDLLHQRPRTLSGGERRRLAIAGVLVMKPEVLLLDEPFANLDYPGIVSVLEALIALHHSGATIVIATHEIEKILAHATDLVVLDKGSVVLSGSPHQVIAQVSQYGIRRPTYNNRPIAIEELSWLR